MAQPVYPQFCALARAAEILGERWTLLVARELLLGPRRFTDLRERLDGISASVLAERLSRLEERGVVSRRWLPPPAASSVYELTASGRALEPVVHALIRWGARYLLPPRARERVEPEWLRLALAACARPGPTPNWRLDLRVRQVRRELRLYVAGGPGGTTVSEQPGPADATVFTDATTVLGLMSGVLDPARALDEGRARVDGAREALEAFPALFDVDLGQR